MNTVSAAVMAFGALFILLAGVGLHRFDDVFARMHAASKASTLGTILVCLGAALRLQDAGASWKLGLVVLMAVITIPAGAHVIARAAWRAGTELAEATTVDDDARERLGN